MGREIRRVPMGWQHPRNEYGNYIPLYDEEYGDAAREYMNNVIAWENGTHADILKDPSIKQKHPYFWDWDGMPPDEESYRLAFATEPVCYQIYETVSEGTPVSPVFETLSDLADWLVKQGHSREAADNFAQDGYVPSAVIVDGKLYMGIDSAALPKK